jgi:hypothetical protein
VRAELLDRVASLVSLPDRRMRITTANSLRANPAFPFDLMLPGRFFQPSLHRRTCTVWFSMQARCLASLSPRVFSDRSASVVGSCQRMDLGEMIVIRLVEQLANVIGRLGLLQESAESFVAQLPRDVLQGPQVIAWTIGR